MSNHTWEGSNESASKENNESENATYWTSLSPMCM